MEIVDCDEVPGQVVSVADAFEPCGFGGKNSCCVEIPECAIDAGKLIDVMESLRRGCTGGLVEQCEVGTHFGGGSYNIG